MKNAERRKKREINGLIKLVSLNNLLQYDCFKSLIKNYLLKIEND